MAARKVLLVGWDAADWKVIHPLIAAGKMPHVQRLIKQAVTGPITTLHPPLSPMLWTSIATGKRPFKHGIHGFTEPTPDGRDVQPVTNLSRKTKALWNILNQNDLRSIVIGWWPSHPAEPINGVMVSDHYHRAAAPLDQGWPLLPHTIHPPELAETLAGLRLHPDLVSPEMVEPFIPLAKEIDQDKDKRLAMFLRTLAECISIHSAALWLLDNRPWDFFAVYYDAIDHFSHGFMRYHPPRQPWVGGRDFELYHNVVSMAYQLHDQMLGELLQKAGEDTTVILMSDHGFHPDHLRPASIPDIPAGPAIEHRDFGILAMQGPEIKRGEVLSGASVLDVVPTILTMYGLPVGEDMDGKALSQAFRKSPAIKFLPSWEEVSGADGRHPSHMRLDPVAAHAALEQMIALGYVERPDENREVALQQTIRELRYNLGEAYQDGDRHLEAYEILAQLHAADPDEQRFAVRLFVSCQALGRHAEMRRIVDDLDGRLARPQAPIVDYLRAQVFIAEQRYDEALIALERVTEAHLVRPGLLLETAELYVRLHRWREAEQIYEQALAIDPDNAHAYVGVCRMALRRRKFDIAVNAALNAVERIHHYPLAHFLLGRALEGMRKYARAADAFRAAISCNPNFPEAHFRLAGLLSRHLGDAASAREHRSLARRMRNPIATRPDRLLTAEATTIPYRSAVSNLKLPPLEESLIVVTGLPRSGTSMLMQMLAAGGMPIVSDGFREADEHNPHGYLESEPVKNLFNDSKWLCERRGCAIKIVTPLLGALPPGLPCRVILSERDLGEVLDSQERMLAHRDPRLAATPERRRMLKDEFARALGRAQALLAGRPCTQVLVIRRSDALTDPAGAAEKLQRFLGGSLDAAKMAAAVISRPEHP